MFDEIWSRQSFGDWLVWPHFGDSKSSPRIVVNTQPACDRSTTYILKSSPQHDSTQHDSDSTQRRTHLHSDYM